MQRQDVAVGLYEIAAASPSALFVAATPSFEKTQGGLLYQVDPATLQVARTLKLDRRAFALGYNRKTGLLYVGNTLDGSLTVVEAASGTVKGVVQVGQPDAKGEAPHTRKVIVDEAGNRIFVTSPEQEGKVWIVDGATGRVTKTFEAVGKWSTGAAYDAAAKRLYVGHGGRNQIVVIDVDAQTIVQRLDVPDGQEHYFINLALDNQGQRIFAADAQQNALLVIDPRNGQVLKRVDTGLGTLDVLFNAARQEVYVTNRGVSREQPVGSGKLTVIDAVTYAVKRTVDLPVHPNSLALSADGQTLYVTVKAPHGDKHPAYRKGALDSVVRIPLGR